jgi:hypothetical protein
VQLGLEPDEGVEVGGEGAHGAGDHVGLLDGDRAVAHPIGHG